MTMKHFGRKALLAAAMLIAATGSASAQADGANDFDESERVKGWCEIGYTARDASELKTTSRYAISVTTLPWQVAPKTYLGFDVAFESNAALDVAIGKTKIFDTPRDAEKATFRFGPTAGYYISKKCFVAMPVNACMTYTKRFKSDDDSGVKVTGKDVVWGINVAPTLYYGNKSIGAFVGPTFAWDFPVYETEWKEDSRKQTASSVESFFDLGFRVGLYIGF